MSVQYLPPAAIRELDRRAIEDYGIPGIVLMENAGRGCAEFIAILNPTGTIIVCCGKGNNGGDGFVIARHLATREYDVWLWLFADPKELRDDALTNYEHVCNRQVARTTCDDVSTPEPIWYHSFAEHLQSADLIVDALLGKGTSGEPRFPLNLAIDLINAAQKPVISIDLPSGLDAATGVPAKSTVQATHTLTFVAQKTGFASAAARACLGQVHVLDIGVPSALVETIMRENPPAPNA